MITNPADKCATKTNKMNLLILLDAAPAYYKLLSRVGNALQGRGVTVFFAIDAPINMAMNPDCSLNGEYRVFSDFLSARSPISLEEASGVAQWEGFIADFDRFQTYNNNSTVGYDWYAKTAVALYEFFDIYIQDKHIDVILYEGVTNSFSYYANLAGSAHGAVYLGLQSSRLPGRHEFHDADSSGLRTRVSYTYKALENNGISLTEEELSWVDDYIVQFHETTPDYMNSNGLNLQSPISKFLNLVTLKKIYRAVSYSIMAGKKKGYSYRQGPIYKYYTRFVIRFIRRWFVTRLLTRYFDLPSDGEIYYLYPLHFHPEASTAIDARWYIDEYTVIRNIAMSLPFGHWLYVKDHPSAYGFPSIGFYKRVSRIPNVKLLPPDINTKDLIKKSQGVITLTSTVGYEAIVLRKPVWVLGEVFYDFHPGCRKIAWGKELISAWVSHAKTTISGDESRRMIEAYFLETMPGSLPLEGELHGTASFIQLADEVIFRAEKLLDCARRKLTVNS